MTQGSRNAGYALFVKDGHLHYIHNYVGLEKFHVTSTETIPTGEVNLRYEFEPTGEPNFGEGKGSPGRYQLYINNKLVGNLEIPHSSPKYLAGWARAPVMRPLTLLAQMPTKRRSALPARSNR